jgi:hypothetical protein
MKYKIGDVLKSKDINYVAPITILDVRNSNEYFIQIRKDCY